MGLRIPDGREQTSWLFTSMVKNWTREDWDQIQLAVRGGLQLGASKLQIQCSNRSAASCSNVTMIDKRE